jgi:hypothetical protein
MSDNKLELVVEVDVNKANPSIKSINTDLSSMEQTTSKVAHGRPRIQPELEALVVRMQARAHTVNTLVSDQSRKFLFPPK